MNTRWIRCTIWMTLLALPFCVSHLHGAEASTEFTPSIFDEVDVQCIANQRYGSAEGKASFCDVYLPTGQAPQDGWPCVVVIHGGSWVSGDKWTMARYGRRLASHGFVAISINYRFAPKYKFPSQVDDVREALVWTKKNADRFQIDLDRVGLFGYSAGAHLSATVGTLADEPIEKQHKASNWEPTDPRWGQMPKISAMCLGGAPCDFQSLPIDNTALSFFLGGSRRTHQENYELASPVCHASDGDPVTQFIHGDDDFIVPIKNSKPLYQALRARGVDVRFQTIAGQGHIMTFVNPKTNRSVLEFFQSVFIKPKLSVWDIRTLGKAPDFEWLNQNAPIREIAYEGATYNGKPTRVFAFYATPGTIHSKPDLDKDLPAVVLVHGGGGTAFADWVWLWAKRGYAAIAMDLSGHRPESPNFKDGELISHLRAKRKRLVAGGPNQGVAEKYENVGGAIDDDWSYHAIGNVIRAHSLIRSFPEVNAERTAVTGISWGGYTTCITASVDDRFKAAVPVYGCGFLYEGESVQRPRTDQLEAEKRNQWIRDYDPSSHLGNCRVPIFFVNGTNDKHYPLRSYSKSYDLVRGEKLLRIEPQMRHGHVAGWAPMEIGEFVDSRLLGESPLARIKGLVVDKGQLRASIQNSVEIKKATLHYTEDDGPLLNRSWKNTAAEVNDNVVWVSLPRCTICFLSVTDQRGAMVTSEVHFEDVDEGPAE